MTYPVIKTTLKIGIATSIAIILFQISNLLLVYKYFRFDYYITAVAVLFLIAGYLFSKFQLPATVKIDQPENKLLSLTSKELQVLAMIAEGKSNKGIAALSFVEVSTIKTHVNNIYGKLDIKNRREAINLVVGNR